MNEKVKLACEEYLKVIFISCNVCKQKIRRCKSVSKTEKEKDKWLKCFGSVQCDNCFNEMDFSFYVRFPDIEFDCYSYDGIKIGEHRLTSSK